MKLILPTLLFLLALGPWALGLAQPVLAAPTCTASVSPSTVYDNSNDTYTFSLTNSSSEAIQWIKITIPSPVYWSISSLTNPTGWTGSTTNNDATLTGNTLSASGSLSISLTAGVGDDTTDAVAWTVQVSGSSDGSSPVNCTGSSLGTSIISLTTAPAISNVAISDVTDSEAKFTWTTNVAANSVVNYGATNSYGSTKSSSTLTTSHSITLTGLSTNTTYHYQIQSTATGSSTGQTSDSTFSTSKQQSTTVTITTADTTAPAISLSFDTSKPFSSPPNVSGTATDNIGVTIVEYSVTGGNIYTKAALAKSGAQSSTFDFTIPQLADGTYTLKIRTRDAAGNTGNFKDIKFTLDTTGPKISLATNLQQPFSASPTISGTVTDPAGVTSVEYSLDSGKSFLSTSLSKNTFSFTPPHLNDGSYPISLRATDSLGNSSLIPSPHTLIIDRLPPVIGPYQLATGLLPLNPDSANAVTSAAALPLRFSVQIIGGPTSASLDLSGQLFLLSPIPGSDLWTALISPPSGTHIIQVSAKDDAAKTDQRSLGTLRVLPPGKVDSSSSLPITLQVFTADPVGSGYVLWDAAGFPFPNPQSLPSGSSYSLLLPPGTYYLKATSPRHAPYMSDIFTLSRPTPINLSATLTPYPSLSLGPLTLTLPFTKSRPAYSLPPTTNYLVPSINQLTDFPSFSLPSSPTTTMTHLDLRGQPTLVTLLSPWTSAASAQMGILNSLSQNNSQIKAIVIIPQTTTISSAIYKSRGSYTLPVISDPDGTLISPLNFSFSPTHYILNNSGAIQKVLIGLQSEESLKLAFGLN